MLTERVLPSATADIVANLGPAMRQEGAAGDARVVGTTVTGLLTRPMTLKHPVWHEALGLRLTPMGIRALLNVPVGEVLNACVPLSELLPLDELVAAASHHASPRDALAAAVTWVTHRLSQRDGRGDRVAAWAAERITALGGALSIGALQERSGYSATRLTTRFRDEFGVTPKMFARLVRFRRALDALDDDTDLAALALDLGLSDQPHLNREFRRFAGATPLEVLAARYPTGLTLAG
ncbi:MAG: hypothetical protein CMH57_00580 [Myxococcales bacterium]|nr:hypothetical protein [Myxococcales bacterium]